MRAVLDKMVFLGLIVFGPVSVGKADIVFTLENVSFTTTAGGGSADGSASGTFTTNDAITSLTSYDITTTTNGTFPGFEYTKATASFVDTVSSTGLFLEAASPAVREFQLTFPNLTSSGSTITVGSSSMEFFGTTAASRFVAAGASVSPASVPEPGQLALAGVGGLFAILVGWRRRRIQAGTTASGR